MGLNVTTVDHYLMLLHLSQSWFKFWNNMPSKATDPVFNAPEYFRIHQDIDWDDYQSRDMLSLHQQSIPYKCHSLILYPYFLTSCNHLQSDQETQTSLGCRLIQQICTAVFKKIHLTVLRWFEVPFRWFEKSSWHYSMAETPPYQ